MGVNGIYLGIQFGWGCKVVNPCLRINGVQLKVYCDTRGGAVGRI